MTATRSICLLPILLAVSGGAVAADRSYSLSSLRKISNAVNYEQNGSSLSHALGRYLSACPDPLINDDFEDGTGLGTPTAGLWYANNQNYDSNPVSANLVSETADAHGGSGSYLRFTNRNANWHGFAHLLDPACLLPSPTKYVFSGRFMLKHSDGVTKSQCSLGDLTSCLYVKLYNRDVDAFGSDVKTYDSLGKQLTVAPDGEWFDLSFEFQLNDDVVNGQTDQGVAGIVERRLFITKPEANVDIYMDDVTIDVQTEAPTAGPTEGPTAVPTVSPTRRPTPMPSTASPTPGPTPAPSATPTTAMPTGAPVCSDPISFVTFEDGDSTDLEGWHIKGSTSLTYTSDGSDSFAVLGPRDSKWDGLRLYLDANCLQVGQEYSITFRVKFDRDNGGETDCAMGLGNCLQLQYYQEDLDAPNNYDRVVQLDPTESTAGQWHTLAATITFDDTLGYTRGAGIVRRDLNLQGVEGGVDISIGDIYFGPATSSPTESPTDSPTVVPTVRPTHAPSGSPTTASPTFGPTPVPSVTPTTASPTGAPVCSDPISSVAFDDGEATDLEGWYIKGSGGSFLTYTSDDSHTAGDSYSVLGPRAQKWDGLRLELVADCLQVGVEYVIRARIKFDKEGGGETDCATTGKNCLLLQYYQEDLDADNAYIKLAEMDPTESTPGVWHTFTASITFDEWLGNTRGTGIVRRDFNLQGVEGGVDIAIDDLFFGLATAEPTTGPTDSPTRAPTEGPTESPTEEPSDAPTPQPTCPDPLVTSFFDDASSLGGWYATYGAPLSYTSTDSHTPGDTYAILGGRTSKNAGMRLALNRDCILANKQYLFTVKLKMADSDGFQLKMLSQDASATEGGADTKVYTQIGPKLDARYSGEWFTYTAIYSFGDLIPTSTGGGIVKRDIYFFGAPAGTDISMDDLSLGLLPTPEPTESPTGSPTVEGYLPPLPVGPYISGDTGSIGEKVTLPEPEDPVGVLLGGARRQCPHDDSGALSWHDPATWGGSLPAAGADVTLPEGESVLVSETVVGTLGIVTVPYGSELIFGENANGVAFDAIGMNVRGALTAGSETCRIEQPVTITLHGDRPTDLDINGKSTSTAIEYKGINVNGQGARLDLHGRKYSRTWTRLAKTAEPGHKVVLLQRGVNWRAGQELLLVTTAVKDSRDWHQNEVRTIKAVVTEGLPDGVEAAIYLTEGVEHRHEANANYQAEVGLLTRNIVVRGSEDDSEPSEIDDGTFEDRSVRGNKGAPDPTKELDGYGGHIIVHDDATGYVEGVELFRMGQTNVMGRYPMHFHLLGDDCPGCYFKDSSVHRSYFRCISIHGTHNTTVTENVAYDVTGFCYYLEDGIEEDNTISFNLAAHIHFLGLAPNGGGQNIDFIYQSKDMVVPADAAASGYYITNVHNDVIGNAASGGWSGFAFPTLDEALGPHRSVNMRPASRTSKTIDGNTAHSSGWWWGHAGAFYNGGKLWYDANGLLVYNAGREQKGRKPCLVSMCAEYGNCDKACPTNQRAWVRFANSKTFLVPGVGINSWAGRVEVVNYESHDVGLSLEALESGFWIDEMLTVCRTGNKIIMAPGSDPKQMKGNGFKWYDTGQEHIITNSIFRNCGYRGNNATPYDEYNDDPTRGCSDSDDGYGCSADSSVFSFLTHSDTHIPEVMQATKNLQFQNCGRRFYLSDYRGTNAPSSTTSGRLQNWYDADGSASGLGEPTLMGSGLADAGLWWNADDGAVFDSHGPLWFLKQNAGPARNIGHVHLEWDAAVHDQVGDTGICGNGPLIPCDPEGYMKHFGPRFANDDGLPVTAPGDVVGPTGGYGWLFELNRGAPTLLDISQVELDPSSHILMGIQYPAGTNFTIEAESYYQCSKLPGSHSCSETFQQVASVAEVQSSLGNVYHVDESGFLTFRIIMMAEWFTGNPEWIIPDYDLQYEAKTGGLDYALLRFSRGGVILPRMTNRQYLRIEANCASADGVYCDDTPPAVVPAVCPTGYNQVAYDTCCLPGLSVCEDAALAAS